MKVIDIFLTEQFIEDWDRTPADIKRRVDKYIDHILALRELPNSLNAHRANGADVWIGHVNANRNPYRILFKMESGGKMIWERLVTHTEMDELLKIGYP